MGDFPDRITTIDADGVALAAIQGLNEVVKEKDAAIQALTKKVETLESEKNAAIDQLTQQYATIEARLLDLQKAITAATTQEQ